MTGGGAAAANVGEVMSQVISAPEALAFIFAFTFNMPCAASVSATWAEVHSTKWTVITAAFYIASSLLLGCVVYHVRPSVTKALAGLSSRSLVEVAGRDVRLTPEGRRLAGATLEKHEFFRRLLCDAGVDGRTASEEACRLEHCISGPSFRRLADHLVSLRGQDGDGRIAGRT